jgi:methyltransferase (TIGR00027 family)
MSGPADTRTPSRTALGVAWLRAAHQVLDAPPPILDDPAACPLFGPDAGNRLRADADRLQSPSARALRSHVVLRSRFAEDRLREAAERGVRTYVMLGAGYDTFAVRRPAWAYDLHVMELDVGVTQADKRARLAAAGLHPDLNTHFVATDFASEPLADALERGGARTNAAVFVAWLGVTMYLPVAAVRGVLRTLAAYPAGSEVVLTFAPPRDPPSDGRPRLAERAAGVGEPWLSYFTPEEMERELRTAGFADVHLLYPEEAADRYFRGRSDGLPPPAHTTIVAARL